MAPKSGLPASSASRPPILITREIERLGASAGGEIGVAAIDLAGGPMVQLNGNDAFPMASTFKIAVAATALEQVEKGRLSLDQMVSIAPDQMVVSEVIADRFIHPGVALSVANLLELMLTQSDNTATDAIVHLIGGPVAISDWLHRSGIEGQRVDRDTGGLIKDFAGLAARPTPAVVSDAIRANPSLERDDVPNPSFDNDPRDTSTPLAMANILAKLAKGELLSRTSTQLLLDMMARCRTGEKRLKGILPDSTPIAHKTGTIGGTVNDVGIITLPDASRIVVVVFVKKSDRPVADRERAIAQVARAIYDFYLFSR